MRHARVLLLKRNLILGLALTAVWFSVAVFDRTFFPIPSHELELPITLVVVACVFAFANRAFAPAQSNIRRYLWLAGVGSGLTAIWFPAAVLVVLWLHTTTGGSL